jgi:superfamily II DNA or RNA helicase
MVVEMIRIYVESKARIKLASIPPGLLKTLRAKTTYVDPKYVMLKRQGLDTEGLSRRMVTWEESGRWLSFWRGSLGKVVRAIKKAGEDYEVIDRRLWLPKIDMACKIDLRDYQIPGVKKMVTRQQTVIQAPCASGKTEMMLKVAAHFRQPTLILVWQERQQRNWTERIPKYFGFWPGGIGGAFPRPVVDRPIVVGMVQSVRNNLAKYKYLFGCVICDEVDRFAAPTLSQCVNEFPAAIRIGASDDERRKDGREFLLYDTFGPRGWKLGSQAQCPVDVVLVPTLFRYSQGDIFSSVREWSRVIAEMVEDEDRNSQILRLACGAVDDGSRVLIWSDRVAHCKYLKRKLLARGYNAGLLIGSKQYKAEADKTESGLTDGSVEIGIGTSVAEKAINIPPLDVGIMTCASADREMLRFRQMRGRLARTHDGKEKSTIYYMFDELVPKLRRKGLAIKRSYSFRVQRSRDV